jgi:endoglucanase
MKPQVLLWLFVVMIGSAASGAPPADRRGANNHSQVTFKRGVNISHWLSQNSGSRTYGAPWFGESDVAWIAQQGFDHIRLPVDIRLCMQPDGTLDPVKLKPVHDAIQWSKSHHLGLVLDAHFLPGADFNPVGGDKRVYTDPVLQAKVAAVWRELAQVFKDEDASVRFEILNEPVAEENKQLNPFMREMLGAIRESNPTRIVYVTSNRWSSFDTVSDVELPDDPNIALTIHNYEPLVFTHQRASWAGFNDTLPAVHFPGEVPELTGHTSQTYALKLNPGDKLTVDDLKQRFTAVADWVAEHRPGIEVYVGEFGVYQTADPVSTRRWIAAIVAECEKRNWGWAVWDYKGGFAVRKADGSGTAVLEGLFAKSE